MAGLQYLMYFLMIYIWVKLKKRQLVQFSS